MSKYIITLKLLSDMCVSDGGVYNSSLDTEACYDSYGIPYIPARRLKGCLRECAIELKDWGKNIDINKLFGMAGAVTNAGAIRISNAYIDGYKQLCKEIEEHKNNIVFHPQNILDTFSYIRTQTSINYETGVAQDGSLRTMRVVNKGLVFVAEVEIDDKKLSEDDVNAFEACVSILSNMGIARTRGLGEVSASLSKNKTCSNNDQFNPIENANRLMYKIHLEEPAIFKTVATDNSETMDYIKGSIVYGLMVGRLKRKNDDIYKLLNSSIKVSNAYIGESNKRLTEVPGYIYSIKNDKENYVDFLYRKKNVLASNDEGKQFNMMKHCYVMIDENENLVKKNVATEERYHHRRPEDKSIGRAVEMPGGDSAFYQMSSICEGQDFIGYIYGSEDEIHMVANIINENKRCFIGNGRAAEYGKATIELINSEIVDVTPQKHILVKLNAPTIIYSDKAMYSVNPEDLIEEICAMIGVNRSTVTIKNKFINYITIGGYNVTWNKRTPTIQAFDKGTVLELELEDAVDISDWIYIGERNTEGYGECEIAEINENSTGLNNGEGKIIKIQSVINDTEIQYSGKYVEQIIDKLFDNFVGECARKQVEQDKKECASLINEAAQSTVNNMIKMCSESSDYKAVCDTVSNRYDKAGEGKANKKEYADAIDKNVKKIEKDIKSKFCKTYNISENTFASSADIKLLVLKKYLLELKYVIRNIKGGNRNGKYKNN